MAKRKQSYGKLAFIFAAGLLLLGSYETQAARILAMFPSSAPSHNNAFSALTVELAKRGHHLTVVTPHPIKSPPANYTQIDVSRAIEPHFKHFGKISVIKSTEIFGKLMNTTTGVCIDALQLPEMQDLMDPKKSGKFDLMIISNFFSECFYPYAHIYDVPVVSISPAGALPFTDALVGNVALPSFVPNAFFSFTDRMTFVERMMNFMSVLVFKFFSSFILFPEFERISRQYFGDHPPLSELHRRTSLVLLNNHFTYNYPRPLLPNMIEVGGLHVKDPKPLPKDLQKFMDDAKDGVIYFSMGSNLKSATFPPEVRDMLLGVFAELRQRVLWKWEGDGPLPGQSPNVRLEKWLPQTDLLAHPNMKIFVTHGGLLSFQEAVARGVPVIGIPFFGDQEMNLKKVLNLGVGLRVPYKELTKEKLLNAIKEILGDASYRNNMKKLSSRVMDRPEHPLQKAAFWTEYVIRHKGAPHLQSAAVDLEWCQLYMIDVISVLIAVPTLLLVGLYYLVCKCCCRRRSAGKQVQSKPKSKAKKQ